MRFHNIALALWLTVEVVGGTQVANKNELRRRQAIDLTNLPTLGAESTSDTATATRTASNEESSDTASNSATVSQRPSAGTASASASVSESISRGITRSADSTASTETTAATSSSTPDANNSTSSAEENQPKGLPLPPRITPALSLAGVFLILTGIVYNLIGVRNRWIHIFLSTGYLSSLSICVLILYVVNPPVSNAIQGAYFVGVFMTGIILGAGALVFKEVTEGLGCLLGGFCLAMWFLTLKDGGLITNTAGKAIFISIFCALSWALSFSHYTRAYSLMGAISFSGATAFVLGIDCFSRGGLKEFWVYIWDLNPDLFPLSTNTYPITRGTRVETVVIVLACIIGIISQLKLWKVVSDRQKKKLEEAEDEQRRQEVVEAALGRHLERRNDRDKSEWERQYGNTLTSKRETILWSEAHGEKKNRYSRIAETELGTSQNSSSSESLEMKSLQPRQPRSVYVAKVKRQSSLAIDRIPEVEEPEASEKRVSKNTEQQRSLNRLEGKRSTDMLAAEARSAARSPMSSARPSPTVEHIARFPSPGQDGRDTQPPAGQKDKIRLEDNDRRYSEYLTVDENDLKKRKSWTSMFSKSGKDDGPSAKTNASQEALIIPSASLNRSRASSLAATLDSDNERADAEADTGITSAERPPQIAALANSQLSARRSQQNRPREIDGPPAPPVLDEISDADPEELVRPPVEAVEGRNSSYADTGKRQSMPFSDSETDDAFKSGSRSHATTSETSMSDVLTKGALDQVPNHLSHVVMSYRTNEWAKHISGAEAPVYEESGPLAEEAEVPAHLMSPQEADDQADITAPPPLRDSLASPVGPTSIEAALPSPTEGIKINPALQPVRTATDLTVEEPIPAMVPPAAMSSLSLGRARSQTESNLRQGLRSSSTPMLHQAFATSPIDENSTVDFAPRQSVARSMSGRSLNMLSGVGTPIYGYGSRSQTNLQTYPVMNNNNLNRSASRLSQIYEYPSNVSNIGNASNAPMRSASQMSHHSIGNLMNNRSDTRLASHDSHQPQRRNNDAEQQRREAMFAEWRMGQQRIPTQQEQAEVHRGQMVNQYLQTKQQDEFAKSQKVQMELMVDARMRGRDMQDLHREAMRKMQAGANKKV